MALVWQTGSAAHVEQRRDMARARGWELRPDGLWDGGALQPTQREEDLYEVLGLPWIAPEIREDTGEIEAGLAETLPRLIELSDLRGDLHCHTNWTDGASDLADTAEAARAHGLDYMAVTDRTQALTIARGLTPERVAEQRKLVRKLNQRLAPFTILHGTEMDVLRDGQLDFSDDVLGTLDYVSVSVHSGFRQPEAEMTGRILRAIRNRYVHTFNHPHGRLLRRRESYAMDMQTVMREAAAVGCALEMNSQPERLDLDGDMARRARALGVHFTISSDAHTKGGLDVLRYGVGSARRAWLTAADVLNTRDLPGLRALLAKRGQATA